MYTRTSTHEQEHRSTHQVGAFARVINSELTWKRGEVVEDWRRAIIVPLHKKGSKLACSNYRGISLLSVPSKVCIYIYAKILDSQLRSRTVNMVMKV